MVGGAVVGGVSGGVAAYAGGLAAAGLAAYGITEELLGGAVVRSHKWTCWEEQ